MSKPLPAQHAQRTVLEYLPPKIDLGVSSVAMQSFDKVRERSTDFRLSEIIRNQTGINEIEMRNFEQEVEKKTLDRLKEVQENAYQEAYQLGMEEGRKEAFNQTSAHINERMSEFAQLIESVVQMKTDLLTQNERHLIELAFHMAQRLAAYQISVEPDATVSIVRQAVEMAQSEEKVMVEVNPEQLQFFEMLSKETGREFEFLKRVKFEKNEQVVTGGCIVTSNYGEVDSRIEARVQKLWQGLEEILPRRKEKLSVA